MQGSQELLVTSTDDSGFETEDDQAATSVAGEGGGSQVGEGHFILLSLRRKVEVCR